MGWFLSTNYMKELMNSSEYKELKKSMVDEPILENFILPKRDEILAINELADIKAREMNKRIRNIVAERLNLEEGLCGMQQCDDTYQEENEIERAKKLLQEQGYDVVKKEEINNLK